MYRILVPAHFAEALQARLGALPVELVAYDTHGATETPRDDADALFRWWLSGEEGDRLIEQNPQLRWIHSGSAGIDHILTDAFRTRRIVLTNSSGVHAPSIAEWVVATMLYVEKDLGALLAQQRERRWEKVERPELSQRTVVVVGAGAIATAIAQRLRPFGPRLIAVRRGTTAHPDFDETVAVSALRDAAARADWLIAAVPSSRETRGIISRDVLGAMKPSARFVNVARGEVVDESALIDALRSRALAGAVLDVVTEEPPPAGHPLWDMPGVILLPHTTWRSPEVRERQLALFAENVSRFVRGEELRNVVDVARGY